jgi:hypothetical protein
MVMWSVWWQGRFHLPCEPTRSTLNIIGSCGLFEGRRVSTSRVSPTRSTLNIIGSCGLFEGKGRSTSRVSPATRSNLSRARRSSGVMRNTDDANRNRVYAFSGGAVWVRPQH